MSELGTSRFCQAVVLARRPGRRLAPVVIQLALTPHLAQERVERAFPCRKVRRGQAPQDIRDVDVASRHDLKDQEFQKALAQRAELRVLHWLYYLSITR